MHVNNSIMKNIIRSLILLFSFTAFSQSFVEQIKSVKLNETRDIRIKLPNSFKSNPEKKYPLILVLDSEFLYPVFEGNLHFGNYWDDIPEAILVGINQNKNNENKSCNFTSFLRLFLLQKR